MNLPIHAVRDEIVGAVLGNQVTIVVGETGSGKTTQLPVFLYEAGLTKNGKIGITEPRRIAATSVARFVSRQLGSNLGDLVGYQVRFDNHVKPGVAIKFMTDGILLREFQGDPELSEYSVVMVDEAHERSQNIDFTLGLLNRLLQNRKDLKVVIASATIDAGKFSRYFGNAPVIQVSGQTFPVEVKYNSFDIERLRMPDEIVKKIISIHTEEKEGDILVFVEGKEEISKIIRKLETSGLENLLALPAYSGLSPEEQDKIFTQSFRKRKVVVATNIAETSITIDGVRYVVDSGLIKQNNFNPYTGISSLDAAKHSRAGCDQRKGRAGRTQPGVCYRMYTEANYRSRLEFTEPEIRRVSIAGVVLALKDLEINDIEDFDFIDPPDEEAFREAYATLTALGAINKEGAGITELGRKMAQLPLDPRISRMILEAQKYGCVWEVARIAAFLSGPPVFNMPKGKETEAEIAHKQFRDAQSDLMTYLKVWDRYAESDFNHDWCYRNFLNGRSLAEIGSIQNQIFHVLEQSGIEISEAEDDESVMKSVTAGLIYNLFHRSGRFNYSGIFRNGFYADTFVHPGSSLFDRPCGPVEWMVATEIVRTKKTYARHCTEVRLEWLPELLPNLFFWTEPQLVSYQPGDDKVVAKQNLVYRNQVMRSRELTLSLEEAQKLQEEAVKKAEASGLIRLTFSICRGWLDNNALISADGRYRAIPSLWDPVKAELGGTYYCEKGRDGQVTPKFQVLNLNPLRA